MTADPHTVLAPGTEFDTIRALLATWGPAASGIGDDAAILDIPPGERLVVSSDACIENVHFRRGWITPEEIGARAAAAALSDLAAMGATPRGLLLSLALPDDWRGMLEDIARGVGGVASSVACPIVGGNMSPATEFSLTTTVLGSGSTPLRRNGVQPGDELFVTGTLGGPGAALAAFERGDTPASIFRARFARPLPRIAEAIWLANQGAHAAIDVSDGLRRDIAHLAAASDVTIGIDETSVPRFDGIRARDAIESGEEYEVVVAFSPGSGAPLAREFRERFGIPLTHIGTARTS